ncbi:hypothetical protein [Candidatus Nitrospira allomarina]|uniref:Uncharacterized protein n=1 Tax=Candidatus Nitrospira allomarina TaxID=3020900 RepID=A0AA96K0Z8_9BACT|nr:hypothetical protein [Candidatus Nitrospira allomarina]WNM60179.1 hypothetical protein PP769_16175 [Candidatus Nitrospira allomarina]
MEPETVTHAVQDRTNLPLRARVDPLDPAHVPTTALLRQIVHGTLVHWK